MTVPDKRKVGALLHRLHAAGEPALLVPTMELCVSLSEEDQAAPSLVWSCYVCFRQRRASAPVRLYETSELALFGSGDGVQNHDQR